MLRKLGAPGAILFEKAAQPPLALNLGASSIVIEGRTIGTGDLRAEVRAEIPTTWGPPRLVVCSLRSFIIIN